MDVVLGATLVPAENTNPRAGMEPIEGLIFTLSFGLTNSAPAPLVAATMEQPCYASVTQLLNLE